MGKRIAWVAGGILAAIGAVFVVGTILLNTGAIPLCGPASETAFASPAGLYVAVVETTHCGDSERQFTVKVLGKEGSISRIFSARSKRPEETVDPRWLTASNLELRYSPTLYVSFPSSEGLKATAGFSGLPVRVSYRGE